MKKCKLIQINDGNERKLKNGNRLYVSEYSKAEEEIERYLNQGYEVKSITPTYNPSTQEEGNLTFYLGGVVVYLEKEE